MKRILLLTTFISVIYSGTNAQTSTDDNCTSCTKTIVSGENASAIGDRTVSAGLTSFASGNYSTASGDYSTAFGDNSKATNRSTFAAGSFAEANGVYSISLGRHTFANAQSSVAMGKYTDITSPATSSFAFGTFLTSSASFAFTLGKGFANDNRLENNVSESLMIGFNSKLPTFFVGKSLGADRTGNIGIGNITLPESKLHIKADDNEDASVYLQPTNSSYYGKIFLGDKNNMISAKSGGDIEFETITGRDFEFTSGNIVHGAGLYMATSQIKASDATGLSLTNMNDNGIFVDDGGNVGIGVIPNSAYVLDINGPINFIGQLYEGGVLYDPSPWEEDDNGISFNNGNVGIGTTESHPNNKLFVDGSQTITNDLNIFEDLWVNGDIDVAGISYLDGGIVFENYSEIENVGRITATNDLRFAGHPYGEITQMILNSDGQLIIDHHNEIDQMETPDGYLLFVGQGILTEKIKCATKNGDWWSDFVFEDDYNLLPILELKEYIDRNGHLPEVPTSEDVKKDGIELVEMTALLLQKVEELSLYIIELKEDIELLKTENNESTNTNN